MTVETRNARDVGAGLFCLAVGLGAVAIASGYDVGTSLNMGPGYFPILLGAALAALGCINVVRGLRSAVAARVGPLDMRPWLLVPAGVAAFWLLIDRGGLVLGILALVLLSRIGGRTVRPIELAVICGALIAITGVLFTYGLNLPVRNLLPH